MAYEETKAYIDNYIDLHSSDEVQQRGYNLYKTGKVALQFYQEKIDTWVFSVRGSKMYKVQIMNLNIQNIQTTCSCPFIWGSTCKHAVAAMLYIAEIDGNADNHKPVMLSNTSSRSVIGYELPNYRYISEDSVREQTTSLIYNDLYFNIHASRIDSLVLEENKIECKLLIKQKEHTVIFRLKNEKLYVSTEPKSETRKLGLAEAICLTKIAKSATPDLFETVFHKGLEQLKQDTLAAFGLEPDFDFTSYFKIGFDDKKGLLAVCNESTQGLLPLTQIDDAPFITFIEKIESQTNAIEHLTIVSKEQRSLGFVLEFDQYKADYDKGDTNASFALTPIIGKPNKANNQISTHIAHYEEHEDEFLVLLTDNSRELIKLTKKIETASSHKEMFNIQQLIIRLLANEPFVYVRFNDAYAMRKSDLTQIEVSKQMLDASYQVFEKDDFIHLELRLKKDENYIDLTKINKAKSGEFIFTIDDVIHAPKNYSVAMHLANYKSGIKMVRSQKDAFFKRVIRPLASNFELDFKDGIFGVETVELDFNKKQIFLSERDNYLIIGPQVEYHQGVSVHLNSPGNVLVEEGDSIIEYKRNFELEDDFIETIASLHPNFELQKSDKNFYLHFNDFSHDMWFYRFFDALQANDIEVYGLKELKSFKYSPFKGKISTSISSGIDWFEVHVNISFGDNHVKLSDIKKAVLKNQKYIQLKDGSVGILPNEWFHKLEKYFRHGEVNDDVLSVSKLRFSVIDELFDNINHENIMDEIFEKRQRLAQFKEITQTTIPAEITADLRPYQKEGLNWLNFLDEMKWGGILADDMGLGKTLQILTFIQLIVKKDTTTNLIVVPTSLLFNWENEINKFAPELKALYHYGQDRTSNIQDFDNYDLVFTTYGVLLRDIETLRKYHFNYAILDESQAIKNPASRRFKAVNLIHSNNRIALSGTPIENCTFDLYAQMSFVNRGFFGGANSFKEHYSNAIDKDGDEARAAELQRLINPFILRRTKENVASELPPKTEDIIFCEMETEQRKVYDAYRNKFRNEIQGVIEADGLAKSSIKVLAALTRLRQICDSPQLLSDDNFTTTESVKIDEIIQHITDRTAKHKILIFSQFVKMLSLIKAELTKRSIDFEYLDGKSSTTQRTNSVNNFQENNDLRVFLISLKAGGTGLNLTAADYVYIVDPWWNPAVENQAIDRCYRIGQDKKVFAYRLICKNTVEEKIMKLQSKKKKIAGDIIQTDENIMKTLDADDIKDLFS